MPTSSRSLVLPPSALLTMEAPVASDIGDLDQRPCSVMPFPPPPIVVIQSVVPFSSRPHQSCHGRIFLALFYVSSPFSSTKGPGWLLPLYHTPP
mmetsp:Transcript_10259/g.22773  ORF Transcript_10259/g.22773 Transcript_10259/m.22773 type:complete len:94 (+) Transcript_10259:1177-1458(+)